MAGAARAGVICLAGCALLLVIALMRADGDVGSLLVGQMQIAQRTKFDAMPLPQMNQSDIKLLYGFPLILHRLLLYDSNYPPVALRYMDRASKLLSEFKVIRWTNEDVRALLRDHRQWLERYDSLRNIQKSDFARVLILYFHGGCYMDYDIILSKSLTSSLANLTPVPAASLTFVGSPEKVMSQRAVEQSAKDYPIRKGRPEIPFRVSNFFMWSKPRCKFVQVLVDMIMFRTNFEVKQDYDVLWTTGPDVLSEAWAMYEGGDAALLPRGVVLHQTAGHWRRDAPANKSG